MAGFAGLLLVPIGAFWMAVEGVQRLAWLRFTMGLVALIASLVVWGVVAMVATIQGGFALGVVTLAFGAYVARRAWPSFGRHTEGTREGSTALPLYLAVVPIVVALLQQAVVDKAVAFSRNHAIRNSAPLISAVERYRAVRGRYPESLLTVNPDYWPGIIGISRYHYEPNGDSYNLFFEQFAHRVGTREFVMYNPRDEHVMTSHAMDLLELTPEQLALERTRGHYAVHDTAHRHWKYFWFD
ncbi:MAG TPA: hypothetical protein VK886_17435 [Vicinamibacterales bacterium]|nr:hypothetical protein [Vicinamibacterales bacterium]